MDNKKESEKAPRFPTAIFQVFLLLKLAEIGQVKDWSWWWVFSPIWISFAAKILTAILKKINED